MRAAVRLRRGLYRHPGRSGAGNGADRWRGRELAAQKARARLGGGRGHGQVRRARARRVAKLHLVTRMDAAEDFVAPGSFDQLLGGLPSASDDGQGEDVTRGRLGTPGIGRWADALPGRALIGCAGTPVREGKAAPGPTARRGRTRVVRLDAAGGASAPPGRRPTGSGVDDTGGSLGLCQVDAACSSPM